MPQDRSYFDEFLERSVPRDSAEALRTLELPETYRTRATNQWLAVTRIVIVTTDADGAYLDEQTIVFYTDTARTEVIDITNFGNDSNDLASSILIRPGQTFAAVWPPSDDARNIKMRIQGATIRQPADS